MKVQLRLHNIQGNITPGFRKDRQAFIFTRFRNASAGRAWVAAVAPDVATAAEVALFNRLFKHVRQRRPGGELSVVRATWINVAFTSAGLGLIAGDDALTDFCPAFRDGLHARAAALGDGNNLDHWLVGGSPDREAHAFILVASDDPVSFQQEVVRQRDRLLPHQASPPLVLLGRTLRGSREHFGYRDDISQPDRVDLLDGWEDGPDVIRPGEFILGYPKEADDSSPDGPRWADDGSYVVFRRIAQHVGVFREMQQRQNGPKSALSRAQLGARVVGRWPSGARLGDEPSDPARGKAAEAVEALSRLEPDGFPADPNGEQCPLFSHVRKANPRGVTLADARRHRLVRRGIPYGPMLAPGQPDERDDRRGLLFLGYQGCIERQFEYVQKRWLNNPNFPPGRSPAAGPDPLVGQPSGARTVWLQQKGGPSLGLALDQFVTVTGGGYYFAPSIDALRRLARGHPLK